MRTARVARIRLIIKFKIENGKFKMGKHTVNVRLARGLKSCAEHTETVFAV